jgi:hypothetical protein
MPFNWTPLKPLPLSHNDKATIHANSRFPTFTSIAQLMNLSDPKVHNEVLNFINYDPFIVKHFLDMYHCLVPKPYTAAPFLSCLLQNKFSCPITIESRLQRFTPPKSKAYSDLKSIATTFCIPDDINSAFTLGPLTLIMNSSHLYIIVRSSTRSNITTFKVDLFQTIMLSHFASTKLSGHSQVYTNFLQEEFTLEFLMYDLFATFSISSTAASAMLQLSVTDPSFNWIPRHDVPQTSYAHQVLICSLPRLLHTYYPNWYHPTLRFNKSNRFSISSVGHFTPLLLPYESKYWSYYTVILDNHLTLHQPTQKTIRNTVRPTSDSKDSSDLLFQYLMHNLPKELQTAILHYTLLQFPANCEFNNHGHIHDDIFEPCMYYSSIDILLNQRRSPYFNRLFVVIKVPSESTYADDPYLTNIERQIRSIPSFDIKHLNEKVFFTKPFPSFNASPSTRETKLNPHRKFWLSSQHEIMTPPGHSATLTTCVSRS